ncbi:MAG: hypothetical protein NC218_09820 [Acetobacter sp.]|nr:hypothetical protein [Acetobacter sp.]
MIKENHPYVVGESTLSTYISAQMGVARSYDPKSYLGENARIIENQSANFLENYINGIAILSDKSLELMPDYLLILKQSSYPRIKKLLRKANLAYKTDVIQRHKEEEKKKAFVDTKFNILQNKKAMAKISSKDLLTISELLAQEKNYSTKRLKTQLSSYAQLKIERTLKGEIAEDEYFVKLVQEHGSLSQKNLVNKRLKNNQALLRKPTPKQEEKTDKKKTSVLGNWGKRLWNKCRTAVVTGGVVLMGLLGGKTLYNNFNSSHKDISMDQDKQETMYTPKETLKITPVAETDTFDNEYLKAIDVLNKAYKDRFDSALEIVLGAEKRDQLYQKIDALAKAGKIEFSNGTTREWYAHAFTMYTKVAPNSEEGQTIAKLLAGQDVNKAKVNDLVIKAERDGTGVKGIGTHSAFDEAQPELQKKHIQKRQNVSLAEKALQNSRSR